MNKQANIKFGIYAIGLLMMGVIGINSSLATIQKAFPDVSQTMIQNLISIPCIAIIPTTLIAGKLMEKISKKSIVIVGIICFIIGGVLPTFMNSLTLILIMRAILGVGVGICQVVSTALAVENFEGDESQKVQGILQSAQMIGCAFMVFVGGSLADMDWHYAFLVHLIGILALILVIMQVPDNKPIQTSSINEKGHLTLTTWLWALFMCALFIGFQTYNVTFSFLVSEAGLGSAADAGLAVAFFTIGGAVMGMFYGKLSQLLKDYCIAFACLIMVIAFVLIANASNMMMCYIGSLLNGIAVVTSLPGIFVQTGLSVDEKSVGLAVSVVTCAQNFGQFICPYIINPLSQILPLSTMNAKTCFLLGAILGVCLALIMLIWAKRKSNEKGM